METYCGSGEPRLHKERSQQGRQVGTTQNKFGAARLHPPHTNRGLVWLAKGDPDDAFVDKSHNSTRLQR